MSTRGDTKLTGGQKKIDKNKDGKISGEDFKMMKKASVGLGVLMSDKGKKIAKKSIKSRAALSPSLNYLGRDAGGAAVKGMGAARSSGMGLQDEQLIPGKTLDYYKDIM